MHGSVVLSFMGNPASKFSVYGSAFRRGGRLLAQTIASRQGYRDLDACRIAFLYRHALELYMKAIVRRGKSLLSIVGEKLEIPRGNSNNMHCRLWLVLCERYSRTLVGSRNRNPRGGECFESLKRWCAMSADSRVHIRFGTR